MTHNDRRFNELDFLRGLACLAVVLFHYVSRGPRGDAAGSWLPGVSMPALDSITRYGYLGVHLFFAISGFVIIMSTERATPRSFAVSRISRLYPAFWVAAPVAALAALFFHDTRWQASVSTVLLNLTMVPHWFNAPLVDAAYWSLAVEIHFYIAVWLILRLGLIEKIDWILLAWLATSTINTLRPSWPLIFWLNAQWAPFFAIGILSYIVRKRGITKLRLGMALLALVLAVVNALVEARDFGPSMQLDRSPWVVAMVVAGIFFVFSCIAFRVWQMQASPFVAALGLLTYPVYLLHQNLAYVMFGALQPPPHYAGTALLFIFAAIVLLAWIVNLYVERKVAPLLKRWLNPHPI